LVEKESSPDSQKKDKPTGQGQHDIRLELHTSAANRDSMGTACAWECLALIAALLVSVLLPLGQWYCREKADRLEGTHNRRRKERNDNLKIETDQDLTHLMG